MRLPPSSSATKRRHMRRHIGKGCAFWAPNEPARSPPTSVPRASRRSAIAIRRSRWAVSSVTRVESQPPLFGPFAPRTAPHSSDGVLVYAAPYSRRVRGGCAYFTAFTCPTLCSQRCSRGASSLQRDGQERGVDAPSWGTCAPRRLSGRRIIHARCANGHPSCCTERGRSGAQPNPGCGCRPDELPTPGRMAGSSTRSRCPTRVGLLAAARIELPNPGRVVGPWAQRGSGGSQRGSGGSWVGWLGVTAPRRRTRRPPRARCSPSSARRRRSPRRCPGRSAG